MDQNRANISIKNSILASTHSRGPRVILPWLEESKLCCCMKYISVMPRFLGVEKVDSSDNHFGAPESQLQSDPGPPAQVLFSTRITCLQWGIGYFIQFIIPLHGHTPGETSPKLSITSFFTFLAEDINHVAVCNSSGACKNISRSSIVLHLE
jgi:hypothetical protein